MLKPIRAADLGDLSWQCIGYAAFCANLEDLSFARWFARLDRDIRMLVGNVKAARPRLAALQNTLKDLIDFLDDPPLRFPMKLRSRIPDGQPAPGAIAISQKRSIGAGASDPAP